MSLINVSNLSFAYDGSYDNVFENVSFRIDTDWKLGFTGRNGRGKTTFLKLLMREYEYSGSISSPVKFEYFPYEPGDPEAKTEAVFRAVCPDCEDWEIGCELSGLEVSEEVLERPFKTLSNGERTKVLLAALFLKENSFLLIDEPTNHLDAGARQAVSDYLNTKQGFILISHDRDFLDNCVDHILSINRADIEVQKGNFSSWYENKRRRDEHELAENERLRGEIGRLSDAAKRAGSWSDKIEATKHGTRNAGLRPDRGFIGHKSAKMMQRAKSIESRKEKAAGEKSKLLKNIETAESLKLPVTAWHSARLAELSHVSVSYEDRVVCGPVSFTVERGDRIALCGKNGSGKSSILKLLCGEEIEHSGELYLGNGLQISYVPQDASFLHGGLSEYSKANGIDESLFKAILRKLDFSRTQFEKDMSNFSAGQKKKVLLARSLCERAHLYVWDEPLNYIDVLSRVQIEELLVQYEPTILFVEHDAAFCRNVATKTVNL